MDQTLAVVDSNSRGDSGRYCSLQELERRLLALPVAPRDQGRVALLMRRGPGGRREILSEAVLGVDSAIPGDAWGRAAERNGNAQITVMQKEVAELIANGQSVTLFGDNLFVELDLSAANLPPGSRVRVGKAILEITPQPHDGCHKFQARFGADALRLVSKPDLRHRNLRGIYMRVVQDGAVQPDDPITVLSRTLPASGLGS